MPFCPYCGQGVSKEFSFCPKCGKMIVQEYQFIDAPQYSTADVPDTQINRSEFQKHNLQLNQSSSLLRRVVNNKYVCLISKCVAILLFLAVIADSYSFYYENYTDGGTAYLAKKIFNDQLEKINNPIRVKDVSLTKAGSFTQAKMHTDDKAFENLPKGGNFFMGKAILSDSSEAEVCAYRYKYIDATGKPTGQKMVLAWVCNT